MSSDEFTLGSTPVEARERELWLQHAIGFILFEDVRRYAISKIDPQLDAAARAAAIRAVDDAVYGLMMVLDGVSGALRDGTRRLHLVSTIRLTDEGRVIEELPLSKGDGMCMGFHSWLEGNFGAAPVVLARS
jgi:hypothetical protein